MSTARDRARWYKPVAAYWKQNPINYCEVRLPGCINLYLIPGAQQEAGTYRDA
jgi:hypothetical protein